MFAAYRLTIALIGLGVIALSLAVTQGLFNLQDAPIAYTKIAGGIVGVGLLCKSMNMTKPTPQHKW